MRVVRSPQLPAVGSEGVASQPEVTAAVGSLAAAVDWAVGFRSVADWVAVFRPAAAGSAAPAAAAAGAGSVARAAAGEAAMAATAAAVEDSSVRCKTC